MSGPLLVGALLFLGVPIRPTLLQREHLQVGTSFPARGVQYVTITTFVVPWMAF